MSRFYKVAGIIAGIAFGIGLLFLMIGVAFGAHSTIVLTKKGFFVRDTTQKWQYTNMEMESFKNIDIDIELAEVHVIESETEHFGISFDLTGSEDDYTFSTENGTVTLESEVSTKQFAINLFGMTQTSTDVVYISIPKGVSLDDISIESKVGDIEINIPGGAKSVNVTADVGAIHITGGEYERLNLSANVGDIDVDNVEVTKNIKAVADVGGVSISGKLQCDMNVHADVGSVNIKTHCAKEMYRYKVEADLGEVVIFGQDKSGIDNAVVGSPEGAKYLIEVEALVGSVKITSTIK